MAVAVMGSPGSFLPTGRSQLPGANLAMGPRWIRTTRSVLRSWTMTAATSRVMASNAGGGPTCGLSVGWVVTAAPRLDLGRGSDQGLATAAFPVSGTGDT